VFSRLNTDWPTDSCRCCLAAFRPSSEHRQSQAKSSCNSQRQRRSAERFSPARTLPVAPTITATRVITTLTGVNEPFSQKRTGSEAVPGGLAAGGARGLRVAPLLVVVLEAEWRPVRGRVPVAVGPDGRDSRQTYQKFHPCRCTHRRSKRTSRLTELRFDLDGVAELDAPPDDLHTQTQVQNSSNCRARKVQNKPFLRMKVRAAGQATHTAQTYGGRGRGGAGSGDTDGGESVDVLRQHLGYQRCRDRARRVFGSAG